MSRSYCEQCGRNTTPTGYACLSCEPRTPKQIGVEVRELGDQLLRLHRKLHLTMAYAIEQRDNDLEKAARAAIDGLWSGYIEFEDLANAASH